MKFFLFFLVACFFGGLLLHKIRMRTLMIVLVAFNLMIMVGYYFFDQI